VGTGSLRPATNPGWSSPSLRKRPWNKRPNSSEHRVPFSRPATCRLCASLRYCFRQRVIERSWFFARSPLSKEDDFVLDPQEAFRKLRPGVDATYWVPPVVVYRSPARGGSCAEFRWAPRTDYEELLKTLNSNDSEESRFFQGMKVAAMGPYEAHPSAPGGLYTIYSCVKYFYFEFDELQSKTSRYRLMSASMKVYLRVRVRLDFQMPYSIA